MTPPAPEGGSEGRVRAPGAGLLARNSLLNLAGQAAPLAVGLLAIPPLVARLGTARFGLLSLLWVALGYFGTFDLGMGRAATKFVAEALGRDEGDRVPPVVWTAVATQALFGVAAGVALAALAPLLAERLLNVPPSLVPETRAAFLVVAAAAPLIVVTSSFRGVLEAAQRFDLVNGVKVPASVATFLLPLGAAVLGAGLPAIALLLAGARLAVLAAFAGLCVRLFPGLRRLPRLERSLVRPLFTFGGWVTVSNVATPLYTYLERVLIGAFRPIAALTYYAVPYEVLSRVLILPNSLAATLFPAFSYDGARDPARLRAMFSRPLKYLVAAMVPAAALAFAYADVLLGLWLGGSFAARATPVFRVLTVAVLLNGLAYIPYTAVHGLGRPDLKAKLDMVELPLFVALSLWWIDAYGLVGAAFAKLVLTVVDLTALVWLAGRAAGLSPARLLDRPLGRTTALAGGLAAALLLSALPGWSPAAEATAVGLLCLGYAVAVPRTCLDATDRALVDGVRQRLPRRLERALELALGGR